MHLKRRYKNLGKTKKSLIALVWLTADILQISSSEVCSHYTKFKHRHEYWSHLSLDYVGTILGLVRDQCSWRLNPLIVSIVPFNSLCWLGSIAEYIISPRLCEIQIMPSLPLAKGMFPPLSSISSIGGTQRCPKKTRNGSMSICPRDMIESHGRWVLWNYCRLIPSLIICSKLTPKEFGDVTRKIMREQSSNPPRTWTFDG